MEDFAVAFALLEGGALEGEALEGFDLGKEWAGEESIEGGLEGGRFFGYGAFGFPEASAEDFFTEIAEVVEGKLEEAIGRGIEGIEAALFAEIFGDEPLVGVVPAAPVAEGVAEKERRVGIAGGFPILLGLEAGDQSALAVLIERTEKLMDVTPEEIEAGRDLLRAAGKIKLKEEVGHYAFFSQTELAGLVLDAGFDVSETRQSLGDQAVVIKAVK